MFVCDLNIASENYADFIRHHNDLPISELSSEVETNCIDYINQEYYTVYKPLNEILPLTIQKHPYRQIPDLYTLLDTTSIESAGILATENHPVLNFRGEGTLIGFIDTGIQYQNPLFRNDDGTTRILGIWDQTINQAPYGIKADTLEESFLYGHEYTEANINEALKSEDPFSVVPSTDTNGHGTFMAGIAAGGTTSNEDFSGAAQKANIAIVKLKPAKQYLRDYYLISSDAIAFQENDIMMGVKYLQQIARKQKMPLIIYLGLGTNQGNHDGSSPLALSLDLLGTYNGIITVCAGGNETGWQHHYQGNLAPTDEMEQIELKVAEEELGFTVEFWAQDPELYTVGFVSPSGELIEHVPYLAGNEAKISFLLENTQITVSYLYAEFGSGNQLISMRFIKPTPGIWQIRVYNHFYIDGKFNVWLPIHGFIKEDTIFLKANPDITITEPGNAFFPITVAAYNHYNNSLYIHSSRGYTRAGEVKPTITAPGVSVYGPGLSIGSDYPMVRMTGTSVAAAHVAGAVANLLSWGIVNHNDPSINDATIRAYLIRGANRSPVYHYPNNAWGYGTLNLIQSFTNLRPG